MWCSNCETESTFSICEHCGNPTEAEVPTLVYWCPDCNLPVIRKKASNQNKTCSVCGSKLLPKTYSDMRPVFPEERLLIEILLDLEPMSLATSSVWIASSILIIDGKNKRFPEGIFTTHNVSKIIEILDANQSKNKDVSYPVFNNYINKFIKINKAWLNEFTNEACEFVRKAVKTNPNAMPLVSFSGGKDSTAVSDIVMKALGSPNIMHVFGDTTLEFPITYLYVERYKSEHAFTPLKHVKNSKENFMNMCNEIGPPARMMRWCCSMFKTGPITRKLNVLVGESERVLTFYGIRKCESAARSKYNRIDGSSESIKIRKQIVASPIFYWKDLDIWLYLLGNNVDFNDAYRLGYDRVGCWCCPNNGLRAQFLSRIYMPEQSKAWRDFLISFAKKLGKPDPEVYVDDGYWKARQGGNSLETSKSIEIKSSTCTTEDNALKFKLFRPFSNEFLNLFIPFGRVKINIGRKTLGEVLVFETKTNMPIISIIPFPSTLASCDVKIKVMNIKDTKTIFRLIGYQVRKYNACRKCLKCESICKHGAIKITSENGYFIDETKCKHCLLCVNQKYLTDGCLMGKYLRTKGDSQSE